MLTIAERRQKPATFSTEHRRLLRSIVDTVRAQAGSDAEAIILFGSRARRDHRPDSDWDILVMLNDGADVPAHRCALRDKLFDLGFGQGTKIDPLIIPWSDADEHAGVVANAIEEGLPLV